MAKPLNKNMSDIVLKYKTGQYGVNQLARMYKVDKATISRYLKANGIEINQHAKNAINALNIGYTELGNLIEVENKSTLNQHPNPNSTKPAHIKDKSSELVEEVIDIVRRNNPKFAKGFQTLSALMIERATEILHKKEITSGDINNISKAISNMNDTLGVFPKMPSIAQQINIDSNTKNTKTETKDINLQIEFLETKKKD